ncbi:MAG: zinc ribbon domain-containing protein [Candidatus Nanopelagicales bacterium]
MAVTASAEQQKALLDLQGFDTKLLQLAHKRAGLPEISAAQDLEVELGSIKMRLVAAQTEASDLKLNQLKAEADVEQVVARSRRDQERLDSGAVSAAKELESLQHEIGTLAKRQAELEDIELEIMQAYENAQQAVTELQASEIETTEKLSALAQTRDDLFADIDFEVNSLTNQRTEIANGLPADLIALYDKIRADQGGVGAALIHRGSCQGCHITIDAQEIDQIRNMPADAIARCDQCRRILVRTAESGL